MPLELAPLISFVVVTTFSPGPNNISSASMGILFGYAGSLRYLTGIAAGFFCVMLMCALVSSSLLTLLPRAEPVLRLLGAIYILWLAYGTARAGYGLDKKRQAPLGFKKGFMLQAVNPKVMVYGLTLFATFLASAAGDLAMLSALALIFALTAFCATSAWALGGAVIGKHLAHPGLRLLVNGLLVALLVYCAFDLSNVGSLLG